MKIILASSSKRRRDFFQNLFDNPIFVNPDIEEIINDKNFKKDIFKISLEKAKVGFEIFKKSKDFNSNENYLIIGCDTVVRVKNKIFGKPKDKNEAFYFLKIMSGSRQEVWSSVSILKNGNLIKNFYEVSYVWFRELEEKEIIKYIDSNEGMDAAGGYKIQGWAIIFISKIKGSYTNIVGFPVEKFLKYYKCLKN
jgi:septum formation protein